MSQGLDNIRFLLERYQRDPALVFRPRWRWVQSVLIEGIERLEREKGISEEEQEAIYEQWWADSMENPGNYYVFIEVMLGLCAGFLHDAKKEEIEGYGNSIIFRMLGLPEKIQTTARTIAIDRIIKHSPKNCLDSFWIHVYIEELNLVDDEKITSEGEIFCDLAGRASLEWLLCLEMSYSTGEKDTYRASREIMLNILNDNDCDNASVYVRFNSLGILNMTDDKFVLLPTGREVLENVLNESHPFHSIVRAMMQDEIREKIIQKPVSSSIDAIVRQSRMVAHEIRNRLLPARMNLNFVFDGLPEGAVLPAQRRAIESGIEGTLQFVDELLKTSELVRRSVEPFLLDPVIRDAIGQIESENREKIYYTPSETEIYVTGHRERVALALLSLLRNALQATADRKSQIKLGVEQKNGLVTLTLDDNGPGVPEAHRHLIFEQGVTFRTGGTGLGLPLAREVFAREMEGAVWCEENPLGGARFLVRLPVSGRAKP